MTARVAGERFGFRLPSAASALPAVWRDLDRAVWRWVRAHGGDAATALAAGWASHADGQGHAALPLSALPGTFGPDEREARIDGAALAESALVDAAGGAEQPVRPFVLDGGHFYLRRNFSDETAVARALGGRRAAAAAARHPVDEAALRALFPGPWREAEARQRAAVSGAPGRRLMALTGGPGTGKTSTVLRMLLALSRDHAARTGSAPVVRAAAPTGKAAQRLGESLRDGHARLAAGGMGQDPAWAPHLDAVAAAAPTTLHRLLGARGRGGGFAFGATTRLPADIVVVDEASMLELGLLRALLEALRDDAVLVLVGDADQLTSVGTGSIMMDLIDALEADPRGDLVRLQHCFRADAALVPVNEAVRAGDRAAFSAAVTAAGGRATHRPIDTVARLDAALARWGLVLRDALEAAGVDVALPADDGATRRRLAALRSRQLLCAQREGPFGALRANGLIAAQLRRRAGSGALNDGAWYPGRAVMVLRNDESARLYNGDVGLCVAVEQDGERRLRVAFEAAPGDAAARLFEPAALPAHEDAFAITVHKSQGSEYDDVAVLLPPDPTSPLLNRQMLYTGVSRARRSIELWAGAAALDAALAQRLVRHGRLAARMLAAGAG